MSTCFLPAHEIARRLRQGELTAVQTAEDLFEQIRRFDPQIQAYLSLNEEQTLRTAQEVDAALQRGEELPPLAGMPVGVKDVICSKGEQVTCGSKILENFISPYDATVIRKLREQKALLIGKLNMDEFAMGSSTENSAYMKTRNPWDLERAPGGSSGGSAAAAAAGMAAVALGSDTGGSVRQPAAFCGTVGFKPTYGRISRFGLVAFASSLDQIGLLTRNVRDAALVLSSVCGNDPLDSTSADIPVPNFTDSLQSGLEGMRVGVPREYFIDGLDPEVEAAVQAAIQTLKSLGAQTDELSLPHTEYGVATYYIIAPAEASSNLARYDGIRYGYRSSNGGGLLDTYRKTRGEGFGDEVKRRIMIGSYALSAGYYDAYYLKAMKARTLVKQDFDRAFENFDLIVSPTAPTPAFKLGEMTDDPLQMYLSDVFTIPASLAGLPGVSIPCGFSGGGLPIGLQLLGKPFGEESVLRAAYAFEQSAGLHDLRPPLMEGS